MNNPGKGLWAAVNLLNRDHCVMMGERGLRPLRRRGHHWVRISRRFSHLQAQAMGLRIESGSNLWTGRRGGSLKKPDAEQLAVRALPPEGAPYLTVKEAAAMMNLGVVRIRQLIGEALLEARKVGKEYRIPRAAVEQRLASAPPLPLEKGPFLTDQQVARMFIPLRLTHYWVRSMCLHGDLESYRDRGKGPLQIPVAAAEALLKTLTAAQRDSSDAVYREPGFGS